MTNENNDSGKTFNFYIRDGSYYETTSNDDGYSHVSLQHRSLCLDIKAGERLIRDLTETLAVKGHDSRGYWGDEEYAKYFKEESNSIEFHTVKVKKLIDKIAEFRLKYNPKEDKISFEYEPSKKDYGTLNWSQQHSVSPLSDLIETEMKRLVPKNKLTGLDYKI